MQKLVEESGVVMFLRYWSFQVAVHLCQQHLRMNKSENCGWHFVSSVRPSTSPEEWTRSIPLVNQSSLNIGGGLFVY